MVQGDYAPGFYVKHFIKDMKIALQEAQAMNLQLPGLKLAKDLYSELVEMGYEDDGTQSLIKLYAKQ